MVFSTINCWDAKNDFEYNNNKYKLILSNNIEIIGPIPYFERTLHRRGRAVILQTVWKGQILDLASPTKL